jgi:hypothetical protein
MSKFTQTYPRHPEVAATDLGLARDRQSLLRKSAKADLRAALEGRRPIGDRSSFEARCARTSG